MKDPTLLTVMGSAIFGLTGIVGFTIRAILTGRLVPRSAVDDIRADRDKWEAAANLKDQAISEFRGRMDANTEALGFLKQLIEALATKGPVS